MLERDILGDIVAAITTPMVAGRIIRGIKAQVRGMCLAASNAAWAGVATTVEAVKAPFEQAVTPLLATLVEAQVSLKVS